jgi:hypothetical protein
MGFAVKKSEKVDHVTDGRSDASSCFCALALVLSLFDATGPLSVFFSPPLPRCRPFCIFSDSTSFYCALHLCSGRTHGLSLAIPMLPRISWHPIRRS